MSSSDVKNAFDLGARVGSLEGYLYVGKDVEANYLPGWLDNIEKGYDGLPPDVRKACTESVYEVMRKVAAYLQRLYGEQDENTRKAKAIVARVQREQAA